MGQFGLIASRYRLLQLLLLAIAALSATYARVAVGPLQEAVRGSLSLGDNQMALLQGMAMAVPIALGSIPVGMIVDRASRKKVLLFSMALALGSFVLSAFASDFSLLFAARCLTGLSLPGILVSAYSMAGDLFAADERGRATTVMAIGEVGGAPAAFALGGALLVMVASTPGIGESVGLELEDWRWSLLCMGGLLVPIMLLMTLLREPARTGIVIDKPPLRAVLPQLWGHRAVAGPLQLARATIFIADGAVFVWGAPLFARSYHLSADAIGNMMGMVLLAGGLLGPVLGGLLVDFCQNRGGPRRTIIILAGTALLSVPAALFALMPDPNLAGIMLAAFLTLGFTIASGAFALTIIVIPGELRGLNLGISNLVGSLFFVGLAPLAVSLLSGALGGEAMIGRALTIVCVAMSLLNAAVLIFSARHFPRNGYR